jgi:hypothetical protein
LIIVILDEMKELTDIEIALTLARHIKNPCGTMVNGKNYNLRYFYLELADKNLSDLKDEHAKRFLESVVRMYE